jgi:hypothetical protein
MTELNQRLDLLLAPYRIVLSDHRDTGASASAADEDLRSSNSGMGAHLLNLGVTK